MQYSYIQAIGIGFPLVQCHAVGSGADYESLVWDAGPPIPSKEVLDVWIASNPVDGNTDISNAIQANAVVLQMDLHANNAFIGVNEVVSITSTVRYLSGEVVPITDIFHVPISDQLGNVTVIKQVSFQEGIANVDISFPKSGYYRITEKHINSRLSNVYFLLQSAFELTVYEV